MSIERVAMDSVPFAFSLAVVSLLPMERRRSFSQPTIALESPYQCLLRLSSTIWSEAALSFFEDVAERKMKYREISIVRIFRGEQRGMCRCEIMERTDGVLRRISLKDLESSRFLRSGAVEFVGWRHDESDFESVSLEEAFAKLVIPFCTHSLGFRIHRDHDFFLDVLQKLHEHQLVLTGLRIEVLTCEMYKKVQAEFNRFLTFQIRQGCLRQLHTPLFRSVPFSIPKEVFFELFTQPQLQHTTHFPVVIPSELFEAFVTGWRSSPSYCKHTELNFEQRLKHKDLRRMGFQEVTPKKKVRRMLAFFGFGSTLSNHREYHAVSGKFPLRLKLYNSTKHGHIN
uniref:Uncharacterized protein n=1 Tax=Steinernema glaseri TaxID=37863 RepID=A0A1I8AH68_9BILA